MAMQLARAERLWQQGFLTDADYVDMVQDILYNFPDDRE